MSARITLDIFVISLLVTEIAVVAILVRQYLRTRDVGFVWLGVAAVVWPRVLSPLLGVSEKALIDYAQRQQSTVVNMGGVIEAFAILQQFIGVGLLLVAVLYLAGAKNHTARTTS